MKILVRVEVDTRNNSFAPIWHIFDSNTYEVISMVSTEVVQKYDTTVGNDTIMFIDYGTVSQLFSRYALSRKLDEHRYILELVYKQIDENWYIVTGISFCHVFYKHNLVYETFEIVNSYIQIADDTMLISTAIDSVIKIQAHAGENNESMSGNVKTKRYLNPQRITQQMPLDTPTVYYMDCLWTSGNVYDIRHREKQIDFKHKHTGKEFCAIATEFNFSGTGVTWFKKEKDGSKINIPSCPTDSILNLNETVLKIWTPVIVKKLKETYKIILNEIYLLKEEKTLINAVNTYGNIMYYNLSSIISVRLNQLLEEDLDSLADKLNLVETHASLRERTDNKYEFCLEAVYPDGMDIIGRWLA